MTILSIDFETWLIGPGQLAPPPVCLTYCNTDKSYGIQHCVLNPDAARDMLLEWFTEHELVGAKVAYDCAVAIARWPELMEPCFRAYAEGRILDVQLNQKLADLAKGRMFGFIGKEKITYSLAALEKRLLGRDRFAEKGPDTWRLRYHELANVRLDAWPKEAYDYAIADAVGTLEVFQAQMEFAELWADDAQAQARSAFVLHLESCRGVHTDPERIEDLARTAMQRFDEVTSVLVEEKLVRGKGLPKEGSRDTKAAKKRMVQACIAAELDVKLTDTGEAKTGLEFVPPDHEAASEYPALDHEACTRVDDPVLAMYAERVKLVTLLRTDIPDLERGAYHEPIQPEYNSPLETGRVSCRKGKLLHGVQIQNRGREGGVRECFRARDLHLFAQADFGGLELASWAQACLDIVGWSTLADDINAGRDPHLVIAAGILDLTYEQSAERKRDKAVKDARQLAKVVNFGFQGGMGAESFVTYARARGFKITLQKAQQLRETWRALRPEHKPYFAFASDIAEEGKPLVQLRSGRIRGGCQFTQAANSPFQGLGADGSLRAHWYVTKAAYAEPESVLYRKMWPVMFVHDELIAETVSYSSLKTASRSQREDVAARALEMTALMERGCNEFVPDVPVKCPPTLARWWSKKTMDEGVFDADGILIPLDLAKMEGVPAFYADGRQA